VALLMSRVQEVLDEVHYVCACVHIVLSVLCQQAAPRTGDMTTHAPFQPAREYTSVGPRPSPCT
jgi:hypothetical protein